MVRRPPRSTRTDTLFPYTTLFRSWQQVAEARRLSRPGAVAQDRGLPAQRRLGSPVRIRRPGGAGEHAVALLLHPARRSRHRDLDAVDAVAEVAVLPIGGVVGAHLEVPLSPQLQAQSTAPRGLAAGRAAAPAAAALLPCAAPACRRRAFPPPSPTGSRTGKP